MIASASAVGRASSLAEDSLACSVSRPSRLAGFRGLCAEGAAAPAGALHVRVIELKSGAFHGLDVVHFGAVQIQQASLVDEHLQIVELIGLVQHVRRILESHGIAESGAPATHHCDAEPGWLGVL